MKTYEIPKIEKMLGQVDKNEQIKVTVVTITYNLIKSGRSKFFKQCIDSIYSQTYGSIEHIIIDGNSNDGTLEMLKKEAPKSLIYSEPDEGIYDAFNKGIKKASGKYIAFLNPYDYIQDDRWLEQVYARFEEDQEIDAVGCSGENAGKDCIEKCQCADYRQFVYRVEKIRAEKLRFEDYSLLTGSVFFTKYCLASEYAYFIPKFQMRGEPLRRQSIYVCDVKLVLRAFVWLLQKAKENDLLQLAGRVTDLLNSENYVRLLTDSTFGFYIDGSSITNPQEDFHTEVLALLVQANQLAVCKGEDRAILRTLSSFIAKRHLFLEKI